MPESNTHASTESVRPHGLIPMGGKRPLDQYLREAWQRRDFAIVMPLSELRAQNMDTMLGNLWHIMNPVLLVAVYFIVFGVLLQIDRGVDNFLAFLAVGVFTFHYSQKTMIAGAKSVASNEGLLRSFQFPRILLPVATVVGQTLAFLPAVGIMLLVALATGEALRLAWLLLIPVFALQAMFNLGGTFVMARLANRFRDVQHVLPFVFRLLFYLSGVLYLAQAFTDNQTLLTLLNANPFYVFVTLARAPLLGEVAFAAAQWGSAVTWTAALMAAGFWFFRSGEHEYGRG